MRKQTSTKNLSAKKKPQRASEAIDVSKIEKITPKGNFTFVISSRKYLVVIKALFDSQTYLNHSYYWTNLACKYNNNLIFILKV